MLVEVGRLRGKLEVGLARKRSNPISMNLWIGGAMLGAIILIAIFAPLLATHPPDLVLAGDKLSAPSFAHPFGTDNLGRDMLSRVLFGARLALGIAMIGVAISAGLGIPLGLIAGYRGGWLDQILARAMDVWLAFPGLLLALVIVSRLGPSL